ncbi:MFS transporter [Pseudomonas sp. MPC6]|uniref:MFS transporter n=1 Tax=unclassified Pseudomonas TaxID=196821 RepID=UPI001110CAB0|nr:MFS transporter [Pseudomonas sp. MPC6]QCY09459.1 MFS transporter [Pseudomonas sp. MPC6]
MRIHHQISTRALTAACVLSAAGALVFNAFPLFLGNIAGAFGFNDEQLGLLGTAYLTGFALIALLAPLWMPRLPWKTCGVFGYLLIVIASFLLKTAPTEQIHYVMGLLGLGSGVIFTLSLGVVSAARNPDRAYGWKIMTEMLVAGVLMLAMTTLVIEAFGYDGFIGGIVALYSLSALSLLGLPKNFLKAVEQHSTSKTAGNGLNRPAAMAALALFFQFGTFSGLWGFMERIGEINGVTPDTLGTLLTLSLVTGLLGAMLCALMGQRFGHRKPILGGMGLTLACVALLHFANGVVVFAVAACALNALLQFVSATQMALITETDRNGRYTVMIAFILAAGGAIGPGVLGAILAQVGFGFGYLWAVFFTLAAMALTMLATQLARTADGDTQVALACNNG